MVAGIRLKVCGLKTLIDAEIADQNGADYLGFIFYPPSPRFLPLDQYKAMRPRLPERKRVAVSVEPTLAELEAMNAASFDFFQIHFRPTMPLATITTWAETLGRERLWLAPRLTPDADVPIAWLELADCFMLDTFHADKFGGTGEIGDWGKFLRHRDAHPHKYWILAGGLTPENIGAAVQATGARFIDVNSGVESSPGVKDEQRLRQFTAALRDSRA